MVLNVVKSEYITGGYVWAAASYDGDLGSFQLVRDVPSYTLRVYPHDPFVSISRPRFSHVIFRVENQVSTVPKVWLLFYVCLKKGYTSEIQIVRYF